MQLRTRSLYFIMTFVICYLVFSLMDGDFTSRQNLITASFLGFIDALLGPSLYRFIGRVSGKVVDKIGLDKK